MAKSSRAYKSAKRTKELNRQKKREEKRKRRLEQKDRPAGAGPEIEYPEGMTPDEAAVGAEVEAETGEDGESPEGSGTSDPD